MHAATAFAGRPKAARAHPSPHRVDQRRTRVTAHNRTRPVRGPLRRPGLAEASRKAHRKQTGRARGDPVRGGAKAKVGRGPGQLQQSARLAAHLVEQVECAGDTLEEFGVDFAPAGGAGPALQGPRSASGKRVGGSGGRAEVGGAASSSHGPGESHYDL